MVNQLKKSNGVNTNEIKLNWPILGNGHIVDYLSKILTKDSIGGSYIFVGPDNLGKSTIANYFAYSLLCEKRGQSKELPCGRCASCRQHQNHAGDKTKGEDGLASIHADYYFVKREKDKKNVTIEQIRALIHALNMSSFLNSYKVGIIKQAETMNLNAANALLKTLEEPKNKVVIILITNNLDALPQTIVSRSQVLHFYPVKNDIIYQYLIAEHKASRSQAKNLSRLALGRPALAVKLFQDEESYERYRERLGALIKLLGEDVNGRFALLEEILDTKMKGQIAVKSAKKIIEIWLSLARDLILIKEGAKDLTRNEIELEKLENIKDRFSLQTLLRLVANLKSAEVYLQANVNPKSVLENVAIQI